MESGSNGSLSIYLNTFLPPSPLLRHATTVSTRPKTVLKRCSCVLFQFSLIYTHSHLCMYTLQVYKRNIPNVGCKITYPLKTSPKEPFPIFSSLVKRTSGSAVVQFCRIKRKEQSRKDKEGKEKGKCERTGRGRKTTNCPLVLNSKTSVMHIQDVLCD